MFNFSQTHSNRRVGRIFLVLLCLAASLAHATFSTAEAEPEGVTDPDGESRSVGAMNLEGVDPKVASILSRFYESSFGGADNWERIESLRFEGSLRMPGGSLRFHAFKKKPDYCKIVLTRADGGRIQMGYDGETAWQSDTGSDTGVREMSAEEARNFVRDAATGGHLLRPTLPGKTIELLGTRRVDDVLCYELRVTLPDGQSITYMIDATQYEERQQILENTVNGKTEVITHESTERIAGVVFPMQSTMTTADGEFLHEIRISNVRVNTGVMPWMFNPPQTPLAAAPLRESDTPTGERLAENAFPDLDTEEAESIMEDLEELDLP